MAKIIGYTPTSIFAAVCGTIATAIAVTNPATAPYAVGIGTAASAVAGGVELNDKEKNIKDNLDKAMDKAWEIIDKKYRLSLHTEKYTDNCLTELKREVMGKNTSVDEFIRNTEIKGFEPSIAIVIEGILKKHSTTLNRDSEILWSDKFTEDAAKEMASTLVATIKSVFENDDHLRILKAISESEERILSRVEDKGDQIMEALERTNGRISKLESKVGEMENRPQKSKDFSSFYKYVVNNYYRKKSEEYDRNEYELIGEYSDKDAYIDASIGVYNADYTIEVSNARHKKVTRKIGRYENRTVPSYLEEWFSKKDYDVMLIYGEPGHGKTTLCHKAMVDFYEGKFLNKADNVLAFSLNTGKHPGIVNEGALNLNKALVWGDDEDEKCTFKECGRSLIFMDGFDEFIGAAKEVKIYNIVDFMEKIFEIAQRYEIHIVVLSRTIAVQEYLKDLRESKYRHFELLPITDKQQDEWLDKHKEYGDYVGTFKKLRKNNNMRTLLGIPFLFRLIVQSRFDTVSTNVVDLYDKLIDHLLKKRHINKDERNTILSDLRILAYDIYCMDTNSAVIDDDMKNKGWFLSFYIKQENNGIIAFYHKSFYQYFLAKYIYYKLLEITNDEKAAEFIGLFAERELDETDLPYINYMSQVIKMRNMEDVSSELGEVVKALETTQGIGIFDIELKSSSGDAEKSRIGRATNVYRNVFHICSAFSYVIRMPFKSGLFNLLKTYSNKGMKIYSNKSERANLREAYLEGANLSRIDLSEADLSDANLCQINLANAVLGGTILRKAKLRRADLRSTNLIRADLEEADLRYANLSLAIVRATILINSDLRWANMNGIDLRTANLSGACLLYTELCAANLSGAILNNAKLGESNMRGSDLSGAKLVGASLFKTNMAKADMNRANLSGANLQGSNLREADLRTADLRSANLKATNLYSSNLCAANLCAANLSEANLKNADLRGIRFSPHTFDGADLTNAKIFRKVKDLIDPHVKGYDTILWL